MTNPWLRLGLFLVGLAVAFVVGIGAGSASDVSARGGTPMQHPTPTATEHPHAGSSSP